MAAITWGNVEAFASELAGVTPVAQDAILALVNAWYDVRVFDGEDGYQTRMVRILHAAHLGSCVGTDTGGASGAGGATIMSESGGDGLSVSYGSSTLIQASNQLSETTYGRQLDAILKTSAARGMWVL